MKRCLMLALGLLLGNSAAAQEEKLIGVADQNHRSVLSLLQAKGCKPLWESQALEDSRVRPAERNNLPIGRVIVLKARSCRLDPPPEVKRRSLALRSRQAVQAREVRVDKLEGDVLLIKKRLDDAEARQKQVSIPSPRWWNKIATWWKRTDGWMLSAIGITTVVMVLALVVLVTMLRGRRAHRSASARVSVQNKPTP